MAGPGAWELQGDLQDSSWAVERSLEAVPLDNWGSGPMGGLGPSATQIHLTWLKARGFPTGPALDSLDTSPHPSQWTGHQPRVLGSRHPRGILRSAHLPSWGLLTDVGVLQQAADPGLSL